jgi:hypothetical protein
VNPDAYCSVERRRQYRHSEERQNGMRVGFEGAASFMRVIHWRSFLL